MKNALASFKDLSPSDSSDSWVSSFDDKDFDGDVAFWNIDTSAASYKTNYYPEVATLDPQILEHLSAPSMLAVPRTMQFAAAAAAAAEPAHKRSRDASGKEDRGPKSMNHDTTFIVDEPTEHDVFLGENDNIGTLFQQTTTDVSTFVLLFNQREGRQGEHTHRKRPLVKGKGQPPGTIRHGIQRCKETNFEKID